MKRIIVVLAVIGMLAAALLPASPAQAQTAGVGLAGCQVNLAVWPGSGSNDPCGAGSLPTDGKVTGVIIDNGTPLSCLPSCSFEASVDSYGEECFQNEPPLIGDAAGTMDINGGQLTPSYEWARVGLTAVITTAGPTGAGVAAFLPVPPLPTCAAPGALTAHVIGAALFLNP